MNNIGKDMPTAKVHLHADDTMIYSAASSLSQTVDELQIAHSHPLSDFGHHAFQGVAISW